MDVDVKGAAIGVASAVYASVGFLLSVFAVVLNPLIPASIDNPHGHHHHPSLILHGKHHRIQPDRDGTDLSAAAPAASQTNSSIISASSQTSSSSTPSLCSQSLGEEDIPAPLPLSRSAAPVAANPQASLPAAIDYFSPNPAEIPAAARDARAETRNPAAPTPPASVPVPVSAAAASRPSTPVTPQPVISRRSTPASLKSTLTPTPPQPTVPPILPLPKSHICNLDDTPPPHAHAFRILHFKRSWTGRRDKPTRSATCPESIPHPDLSTSIINTTSNVNVITADTNATSNSKRPAAISRPPSISSIKHFCPTKKAEEKTLRKSLSSPESGLSKWKSHRRKCSNAITNSNSDMKSSTNPTPDISQLQPHLRPSKATKSPLPPRPRSQAQTQPRPRTQPYEAPYFFPSPASPDAGDYIRRAKSGRPSSSHDAYPSYSVNHINSNGTPPSSFRQLPLVDSRVNNNAERGIVSAPPTKLKFSA